MKRLLPPYLFGLTMLAMIALDWLAPIVEASLNPWNHLGWLAALGGLALSVSGKSLFSRRGTNINTFNDPDFLVTDGPFRYSRNPMYLGFAIALAGIALVLSSLSPAILAALFVLITDRWYIRFEEIRMRASFGEQYDRYCGQTRRWI